MYCYSERVFRAEYEPIAGDCCCCIVCFRRFSLSASLGRRPNPVRIASGDGVQLVGRRSSLAPTRRRSQRFLVRPPRVTWPRPTAGSRCAWRHEADRVDVDDQRQAAYLVHRRRSDVARHRAVKKVGREPLLTHDTPRVTARVRGSTPGIGLRNH